MESDTRKHRAVLQHESGRLLLRTNYKWAATKGVATEVLEILQDNPASETVDPDINNWEPYVQKIADLTGAEIVEMVPYPKYEPDTMF